MQTWQLNFPHKDFNATTSRVQLHIVKNFHANIVTKHSGKIGICIVMYKPHIQSFTWLFTIFKHFKQAWILLVADDSLDWKHPRMKHSVQLNKNWIYTKHRGILVIRGRCCSFDQPSAPPRNKQTVIRGRWCWSVQTTLIFVRHLLGKFEIDDGD